MGAEPTVIKDRGFEYYVYYQDAKHASMLADETIQLILTSPPFFYSEDYSALSREEGRIPSIPEMTDEIYKKYLSELGGVLKECARVLSKDGVLLLVVDFLRSERGKGSIHPLPFDMIRICCGFGLKFRDSWIYSKRTARIPKTSKGFGFHEFILFFSKGDSFKWNLKRAKQAEGKPISSIWEFELDTENKQPNLIFCPFPAGLVDRAIRLFTDKGEWVMDPFLGSGLVVARARALKRNAIGFEINPSFKDAIEKNLRDAKPD